MSDPVRAWETHRKSCRGCQRQWKRFEDGEMTCETGVDLYLAVRHGPDCEAGPLHCEWLQLPSHKHGWHSADNCPHASGTHWPERTGRERAVGLRA